MTPPKDPILDAEVEQALAPYRAILTPPMIELLRETITKAYMEHPAGQRIIGHLRKETRVRVASVEIDLRDRNGMGAEALKPHASGIRRRSGL